MSLSLKIVFRGLPQSADVEGVARTRALELMRYADKPVSCEVVVHGDVESMGNTGRYHATVRVKLAPGTVLGGGAEFVQRGQWSPSAAVNAAFGPVEQALSEHEVPASDARTADCALSDYALLSPVPRSLTPPAPVRREGVRVSSRPRHPVTLPSPTSDAFAPPPRRRSATLPFGRYGDAMGGAAADELRANRSTCR